MCGRIIGAWLKQDPGRRRKAVIASKITGADFSDAIMPEKTLKALCLRDDAKGVNSKTQVPTRESLKHESEKAVRNQQRAQAKARRKSSK